MIDPSVAPVRSLPRDERELFIMASNGHVLAFDNLSGLPPWLSDTLCRLTSGGAFSTRRLFTDQDEILFAAARPVICFHQYRLCRTCRYIQLKVFARSRRQPVRLPELSPGGIQDASAFKAAKGSALGKTMTAILGAGIDLALLDR